MNVILKTSRVHIILLLLFTFLTLIKHIVSSITLSLFIDLVSQQKPSKLELVLLDFFILSFQLISCGVSVYSQKDIPDIPPLITDPNATAPSTRETIMRTLNLFNRTQQRRTIERFDTSRDISDLQSGDEDDNDTNSIDSTHSDNYDPLCVQIVEIDIIEIMKRLWKKPLQSVPPNSRNLPI